MIVRFHYQLKTHDLRRRLLTVHTRPSAFHVETRILIGSQLPRIPAYRHVGIARFPVSGKSVSQAESELALTQ